MEVGVIVPCRGPAPWLGEALASVAAEDPARVVLVDDGSSPPLEAPAAVEVVRRKRPGGPAAARATGLGALGDVEWVGLCDADDAWLPGKLEAQAALADDADLVAGPPIVVGEDGQPTGEAWPPPGDGSAADLYERAPLVTSSVLVRRAALEDAGGFEGLDVRRGEDLDLWLRLAASGARFAAVAWPIVRYRRRVGALTADIAAMAADNLKVRAQHAGLVPPALARRVRARDLRTLARGRIRERRWAEARAALAEAAALEPPPTRDRMLAGATRLPGVRAALGRREPYGA